MQKIRFVSFWLGQTIIEMLVMLTIVALLSSTLILFNKQTQGEKELYEEARKLVVDLRTAQDLAFSMQDINGETPCGYGVELLPDLTGYEIFVAMPRPGMTCADVQNGSYIKVPLQGVPAVPEAVFRFSNLELYSYSSNPIIFVPPYPRTIFFPSNSTALFQFFNKKVGSGSLIEIQLNKAGQITLQGPTTP
ncbi:MAG: hypothetical protein UX61_C0006G0012 [Parcubacteria group bacterium GW2011_GWA2_46_7]|nr:MAG: hypothetical protein UX14_C0032G0004 [Parcubacteria group bacterium GW2011_GWF1_45_5]KKU44044.1 MAG: hypothetical protein UX61_C0006G0012 [Parcubacteria group bacterium GW2011_GWA2_46_7]KKU47104.1 MAG: hypothetical protein UX66_C0025G0013 [Parcubacteria group bacterium GW2011_GWF2_46_8]